MLRYPNSTDRRARWKSSVRRHPRLTRALQFLFDPAFVRHDVRNRLIASLPGDARILNLGSGVKRFGRSAINLDLEPFANVDVVADGQHLPFLDDVFDAVLVEYVVEHVPDSSGIVRELYRVLRRGGLVYATVPFMQSYHGNPDDFYRFTISGFKQFWRAFDHVECGPFGGPTSALVCTAKEYLAILLSFNSRWLYAVLSQVLILPIFPLKYLDLLLVHSPNAHNLAFSLYYVGRKP